MTTAEPEPRSPRRVVLRYEDSWAELDAQLVEDRRVGLTPSLVRDEVAAWLDEGSFVEIGSIVKSGSTSYRGGDTANDEQPDTVPADGLIAGWGRRRDQLVFVAADDTDLGRPVRGGAGASKATRVRAHALAQSAPLVQILAAGRLDPDAFIGAEFVRFGYGVDLDFETEAAERILKIGLVTGPLTDQAAMEAIWCHLVVLVGDDAALSGHAGPEALSRGLADAVVGDLGAAFDLVDGALAHLPPSRFDPPPLDAAPRSPGADGLLDDEWELELTPGWQPGVRTRLGTIDARPVGLLEVAEGATAGQALIDKMLRTVRFCEGFSLPLLFAHAGLGRPREPEPGDVDGFDRLREALYDATIPILEVRRGERSLHQQLGVRPVWSADVTGRGPADAFVSADQLRPALTAVLAAVTPPRMRPDEDPRIRSMAPRTIRSE
jgi:hypothetical protein